MTVSVANIEARFAIDTANAERSLQNINNKINNFSQHVQNASSGFSFGRVFEFATGGVISNGISNIVSSIGSIGSTALDSFAYTERLESSLQSLYAKELMNNGSAENMTEALEFASGKAKELLGWIEKLAVESPFKQSDVADAFRTIQAYGFAADESQRLTQALIDFTAGSGATGATMSRLGLALGQIRARGKVAAGELNQLTEAGLDARTILAKAFNVGTAELMKMIEKGLIPADKAIEAITKSLETDFGGAAKRQAGTFSGLLSSLSDIKELGLRDFFTPMFEKIQPYLSSFVDILGSPAIKASIESWGSALGDFVGSALDKANSLISILSSGNIYAAIGEALNADVQVLGEITSVKWGDFIGVLNWNDYVFSLKWKDFIATFQWSQLVTSLQWKNFILAFDWSQWVGTMVWGDFVSIVNWWDWIYILKWGDFLLHLDWYNFVFSLSWGNYIYELSWATFVGLFTWTDYAVALTWGDFVSSLDWELKVFSLTWGDFITVFSWDKWIVQFKWGDWAVKLSWTDFINGITWSDYAVTLTWGEFLFTLDWSTFVAAIVWGDFMSAADWSNWIYTLVWGDFVFQLDWSQYAQKMSSWADYISKLTWADIVTAFTDWSTYISKLTWTDIIVKVLDWSTWIPALIFNEFISVLDWGIYLGIILWSDYLSKLTWSDFVNGTVNWISYISSLNWNEYITESLNWTSYVFSLTWSSFVGKLDWGEYLTGIDLTSWVPAFPGWDYLFGDSIPASQGSGGGGGGFGGEEPTGRSLFPRRPITNTVNAATQSFSDNVYITVNATINNKLDEVELINNIAKAARRR